MRRTNLFVRTAVAVLMSNLLCVGAAFAYESENAVPLTIDTSILKVVVESIDIRLHGRDVTVSTKLYNDSEAPQVAAFYAYTPLFHQLGEGENYADKTFSNLRVAVDGQPRKIAKHVRAYFLGRDITERLVKAGVDPTPSLETPYSKLKRIPKVDGMVPEDWEASIVYSWADKIPSGGRATHEVQYQDMPQFDFAEVTSDNFTQRILQYCGDPEKVRSRIRQNDPDAQQVIVERHELPVAYMGLRDVTLEVKQPEKNWLGGRPLISLVCGIKNANTSADIRGTLGAADPTIHLMTISLISPVGK